MADEKVILVTGVAGYWGSKLAARLITEKGQHSEAEQEEKPLYHVIGMDSQPPQAPVEGMDFIQADIRNPLFIEVLRSEKVSMVCHLAFLENVRPSESTFDFNVIGAMSVLGTCAEAGVQKVVLRSSTTVYGADPTNPAFLTEQSSFRAGRCYGSTKHWVEIEAFCNGFRQQASELSLTVLRFPGILGPSVDSPLTRFLKQNPTPVLLGFDPLMQIIHENDVLEALVYALQNEIPGVYNVAAEGVLPLTKILGLASRIPLPIFHVLVNWEINVRRAMNHQPERHFPIEPDFLRYPWIADLARMRQQMGFVPTYTAEEALREFAGQLRLERYRPETPDLAFDEERLRDILERRRRLRERQSNQAANTEGGRDG